MRESYALAHHEVTAALKHGGRCLDCGARTGAMFDRLHSAIDLPKSSYFGVEWDPEAVKIAQDRQLQVVEANLNEGIPFPDRSFDCVFGLSVLEHLVNPCRYLAECQRVVRNGGTLVILTPNISTYFTAALILAGRMPSSGPHPDSDWLLKKEELFKVSSEGIQPDAETDTPVHRHLVVFSYRVLKSYLNALDFDTVRGSGFGVYPFPNFTQRLFEKLDPYHCHQMVFVARK
jgi:SAM-dependent methyltransferase